MIDKLVGVYINACCVAHHHPEDAYDLGVRVGLHLALQAIEFERLEELKDFVEYLLEDTEYHPHQASIIADNWRSLP
jgi:hypothetical protein